VETINLLVNAAVVVVGMLQWLDGED